MGSEACTSKAGAGLEVGGRGVAVPPVAADAKVVKNWHSRGAEKGTCWGGPLLGLCFPVTTHTNNGGKGSSQSGRTPGECLRMKLLHPSVPEVGGNICVCARIVVQ